MRSHAWLRVAALSTAVVACAVTTAFAQTLTAPCSAPELVGDLGISGTYCTRCSMTGRHLQGQADTEFATEPKVTSIRRGGPADGKLEAEDVLVALDGLLITSQAGAVQYSWLTPGKPVRVTVRRAGVMKDVEIVPAPTCKKLTTLFPRTTLADWTQVTQFTTTTSSSSPRGWFGIAVTCLWCATWAGAGWPGSTVVPYGSYLDVTDVTPDSPAEKGGLKAGDLLIAIDGLSLKSVAGATALRDVKPNQKVLFLVVRDAEVLKISVTAGPHR